jgi:hypothetical protein
MGFMDLLNKYYDISLLGTRMIPIVSDALTFIVIVGGMFVLTIFMIPFFVIGLIGKAAGVKDEES